MNNNYNFNESNNGLNNVPQDNNSSKNSLLNIGLVIMLVIGIIVAIAILNLNHDTESDYNDSNVVSEVEDSDDSNGIENSTETEEEVPDLEEETSNEENESEEEPISTTTTNTTTSLECTKTLNNDYGKFVYTNTYTFKNNQMVTGTMKITSTLNKSYSSYRDSLIQSLKDENAKLVKLDGITESVSKKSNGFTYTLKLDANKLSKSELADMGYKTLNYSGVKIAAYDKGYTCKK